MTNAELIQKIRAEIERLAKRADRRIDKDHASHNAEMERYGEDYWNGYGDLAYALLSLLSTLESEKPMQEGLEEELDRFIASGKSVTVDDYGTYKVSYHDFKKVARHFAEWQKEQDDRLADIIYQQGIEKGKDDMKEQMLKEAVEGKVFMSFAPGHNQMVMADVDLPTNTKVKIIIVKEDEK